MKLEKVIVILSIMLEVSTRTGERDKHDAIKLAIEALRRIECQRTPGGVITDTRLPGETEE